MHSCLSKHMTLMASICNMTINVLCHIRITVKFRLFQPDRGNFDLSDHRFSPVEIAVPGCLSVNLCYGLVLCMYEQLGQGEFSCTGTSEAVL